MNTPGVEDVTELLRKWNEGDEQALDQLIPLVYDELLRLARQCLRHERPDHSMHTGTLVHEAYLRLLDCDQVEWRDRRHFFAMAARLMRRVLVDEARKRKHQKRGGGSPPARLDEAMMIAQEWDDELLALNEALEKLDRRSERKCRVVELRYFIGLTIEETAEVLGVTTDIVKREWNSAKRWLHRELSSGAMTSNGSMAMGTN